MKHGKNGKWKKLLPGLLAIPVLAFAGVKLSEKGGSGYPAAVTPAMAVLDSRQELVKSGVSGEILLFSEADLERLLGDTVPSVEILSLPPASTGELKLGTLPVMEGQRIASCNLPFLCFVPKEAKELCCSFDLRTGGTPSHTVTCTLRYSDKRNTAPVAAEKTDAFTYKNIALYGALPGSDAENDSLRYEITDAPDRGILRLADASAGVYVYTPEKNYTGKDGFSYRITDSCGNVSEEGRVTVSVKSSGQGTVYTDLIGSKCHRSAITLTDRDIMEGAEQNGRPVFDADEKVNRLSFLVMAMKTAGIPAEEELPAALALADYSVIPAALRPYVDTAYQKEFLRAENGRFSPDAEITVAEACLTLATVAGLPCPVAVPTPEEAWAVVAAEELLPPSFLGAPDAPLTKGDAAMLLEGFLLKRG